MSHSLQSLEDIPCTALAVGLILLRNRATLEMLNLGLSQVRYLRNTSVTMVTASKILAYT